MRAVFYARHGGSDFQQDRRRLVSCSTGWSARLEHRSPKRSRASRIGPDALPGSPGESAALAGPESNSALDRNRVVTDPSRYVQQPRVVVADGAGSPFPPDQVASLWSIRVYTRGDPGEPGRIRRRPTSSAFRAPLRRSHRRVPPSSRGDRSTFLTCGAPRPLAR